MIQPMIQMIQTIQTIQMNRKKILLIVFTIRIQNQIFKLVFLIKNQKIIKSHKFVEILCWNYNFICDYYIL
jgi:hypothetical protein